MSQFEIITNQATGAITFNFAELKNQLTEAIFPYTQLVVTEDSIQEGKKTRAKLNGLKKAINDKKIEVKKAFNEPYEVFENQVKELMTIIDKGSQNIDTQVKTFEEMQKQAKLGAIKEFYAELRFDLVSFEQLYDEKWLNATVTEKSWKEQLSGKVETVKVDLALLGNFDVEDKGMLKSFYLETLNMSMAKARYDALEARRAQIKQEPVSTPTPIEIVAESTPQGLQEVEEILTRSFWVKGTKNQIIALGNYMNANNMTFGKVE